MSKKWKRILLLVPLTLLAAACLWYTRPMAFEELVDLSDCGKIQVYSSLYIDVREHGEIDLDLEPGDDGFDQLLDQLRGRTFRRSLTNLLPKGTRTHLPRPGDTEWWLVFSFKTPVEFSDGSMGSSPRLHIENFYGKLTVSYGRDNWRGTTPNQEQWVSDVMEIITAAAE